MDTLLRAAEYQETEDAAAADVVIVNTCGFLQAAVQESLSVLQSQAAQIRPDQTLIAAGCLAQREGKLILETVPRVQGLLGTRRWMDIVPLTKMLRQGKLGRRQEAFAMLGDPETQDELLLEQPPSGTGSAYLKISDGCNAPCAFCTIPSFQRQTAQSASPRSANRSAGLGAGRSSRIGDRGSRHHGLWPGSSRT